jgi:uncharacterized SAM-binding protein YcdF (DUF218 family)
MPPRMIDSFLRQLLLLMEPIGLAWLALIALTVILWRRRQRFPSMISGAVVALVTLVGGTDLSGWLLRQIEEPWKGLDVDALPVCDAAIVLGGGLEPSRYEAGGVHLTVAGDRLMMGVEVLRKGKAPVLVLGGGLVILDGRVVVESALGKAWLESWQLAAGREVVSLGVAANTRDEAVRFVARARERGWRRVLLVTSASHMRRSAAVFRALGIEVVPVPCNFLTTVGTARQRGPIGIPNWRGFEKFGIWMHEVAGWAVYRWRGWVG